MKSQFWDDLAWDVNDPDVLAAYLEASELIETLDGIANA